MSELIATVVSWIRLTLMSLWYGLATLLGGIYCIIRYGHPDNNSMLAHLIQLGVMPILGLKIKVEGIEHLDAHRPCVFVANHQSGFDIAIFSSLKIKSLVIIGKKELKFVPFFGLMFAAGGNIFLDRNNRSKAVAGLHQVTKAIRERKLSVFVFPEGTRHRAMDGTMLPFKKGAFHMAMDAQVPIVPIVCSPLKDHWDRSKLKWVPGELRLKLLPPHLPGKKEDPASLERLMTETRAAMEGAIAQMVKSGASRA